MKPLRTFLIAFAMLIGAATIASAATGGDHGNPTPSPSVTLSDSPSPTEAPEPTEAEPSETEASEPEATTSDKSGTAPDFSACAGLHGLDNAICRHEALLNVQPKNSGLANSLNHLQANRAAQAAGVHGNSGSHGPPGS